MYSSPSVSSVMCALRLNPTTLVVTLTSPRYAVVLPARFRLNRRRMRVSVKSRACV